jgi:hypothetical protein
MIELLGILFLGVAVLGGAYWYIHKKNPDLAQEATDTIVDGIKEDVIQPIKDKID